VSGALPVAGLGQPDTELHEWRPHAIEPVEALQDAEARTTEPVGCGASVSGRACSGPAIEGRLSFGLGRVGAEREHRQARSNELGRLHAHPARPCRRLRVVERQALQEGASQPAIREPDLDQVRLTRLVLGLADQQHRRGAEARSRRLDGEPRVELDVAGQHLEIEARGLKLSAHPRLHLGAGRVAARQVEQHDPGALLRRRRGRAEEHAPHDRRWRRPRRKRHRRIFLAAAA
jgi:hypothetical protein